jgi:DNA-binding transcriptional LysR family regulator
MTLKQIEAFYLAARLGTFAIAASRLHVTQSSLSKRITELESDLGQPLFDRTSKRARLTAAGEALMDKARRMLEIERSMRDGLREGAEAAGTVTIGLSEYSATTWFPVLANTVRQEHPGLQLRPQVGLGKGMERLVERGEMDCAVIAGGTQSEQLGSKTLASVRFCWIMSPQRADGSRVLDAEGFARHPVISSTEDSGLNQVLGAWQESHQLKLRKSVVCNSMTAIIALTVAGVGISFMPMEYVQPLVRRRLVCVQRSQPSLPPVPYTLIWREDDDRHLLLRTLDLITHAADFTVPNALWGRPSA